ncbi:MAG: methylated-DNA--[protein]-cysteine S-methyltransferase [Asticcacaulis sp.]
MTALGSTATGWHYRRMDLFFAYIATPFGPAAAAVNSDDELVEFSFLNTHSTTLFARSDRAVHDPKRLVDVSSQIYEYFEHKRREFTLKLKPSGTPFQQRVWAALCEIPFGETISYQQLAYRVGDVKATQAVGAANGKNPIALIIPCHRVIGKDGSLTGYGGGLGLKRQLLDFETPPLL